jgi:predicted PurR-regulated permease PerM
MRRQPVTGFYSWLQRLVEASLGLLVVALLLRWAWQVLRPLLPVLLVAATLAIIATVVYRRRKYW